MESNLTKTQSTGLINNIRYTSPRHTSLEKWYDSKEQSFALIRKNIGEDTFKGLMLIEVNEMVKVLRADMDALHVREYIDYIANNYYYFNLSDLTMVRKRLLNTKTFPKPILQDFIIATNEYDTERTRFVESQRTKENSIHKSDELPTTAQVLQTYEAMKKDAVKPQQTQKERDVENLDAHNEKLKELHRLYPKQ